MSSQNIFILRTGIGKARTNIFEKQLSGKFDVRVCETFADDVTHVVVDDALDPEKIFKLLKLENRRIRNDVKIIKSKWLSICIDKGEFVDSSDYEITQPCVDYSTNEKHSVCEASCTDSVQNALDEPAKKKSRWACMKSSKSTDDNHNKFITDELEKLMKTYENMNEKWRALGYKKAISAIKKCASPITSYQEAINLTGVGSNLAEKICEIIDTGELRKLNELKDRQSTKSLDIFNKVWGAGPQTAKSWVAQGFRTLDDLREKGHLTRHQQVGLRYYDELCEKINRQEVEEIGRIVRENVFSLRPGCEVIVCGSFRRGRESCGDVDVLISHRDGRSHVGLFEALIEKLRSTDFITDHLMAGVSDEQQKYLGICKLPDEGSKHRRIDVIVVPYSEYFPALLYFTGSGHFNRSMRNLASKMGMSLNEHGLFKKVIRNKGVKIHCGGKVDVSSEEEIFEHLGIPFRLPEERDY